jgi:hypothetical protein
MRQFMPLFPIHSHFFPPECDIGSEGLASQKNLRNFPFGDKHLAVRISRTTAVSAGVLIEISKLPALVDVPEHARR